MAGGMGQTADELHNILTGTSLSCHNAIDLLSPFPCLFSSSFLLGVVAGASLSAAAVALTALRFYALPVRGR
jgi:hypothetical protein